MDKWDPKWNSDCTFEVWNSTIGWYSWVPCKTRDNYWAGAKKACDDIGMSLPDESKLESIYHKVIENDYTGRTGIPTGTYWSSSENGAKHAVVMRSYDGATFNGTTKDISVYKVLCVGD